MSTNNLKEQAHVEKLFFSALGSKLLLSAILLPLIILCLHGGTPDKGPSKTPPINREMSGAGKIATSAIHMVIHVEGNNITGYYFYDKYRVPISLTGQLEKDNRFTITETNDKGTITGYFTGTTTTFSRLEGRWLGPGKKKFLPFRVDCSEHFESHTIDKKKQVFGTRNSVCPPV